MKQKKVISLPTNSQKIYRQILAFMNFMLNLTPQERDILAEFIRLNNEFEALPLDKRIKFILSTDVRKDICTSLSMEAKQFNVVLSRLKKKTFAGKLLLDDATGIHSELCFKPDEEGFRFEINFVMTQIPIVNKPTQVMEVKEIEEEVMVNNEAPQPPVEYQHDASKAPVIEEEDWDIEIEVPNA
jgi:hypothetical protein